MEAVYLNLLLYLHAEAPEDQWSFGTPWAWLSSRGTPKVAKLKMGWEGTIGFSGTESSVEADTSSPTSWPTVHDLFAGKRTENRHSDDPNGGCQCAVHPPGLEPGTH